MAESSSIDLDEALDESFSLVRYLERAPESGRASQETIDRARSLADRIERSAYAVVSNGGAPGAAAFGYQALEGIDSLRAAAGGRDVGLMRAAAYEIRDHLMRARDVSASASDYEE